MKKFRERNLALVAAVAAALMVVTAFFALEFSKLPIIGTQKTYSAYLSSAVGLQPGDVVTIAGVRVGAIDSLSLHGDAAKVKFHMSKSDHLGSLTGATVKVLNPVGVEYMELNPAGPGRLSGTIPEARTSIPGTLVSDLNQLTNDTQQIDINQLVSALKVITQTVAANSPTQTKAALDGVAQLSAVLAGRQQELADLVTQSNQLTGLLNSHSTQLVSLLGQSNLLLGVLAQRKEAIDNLLATTTELTNQIDHIIVGDRSVLTPMLDNLKAVSAFLANDSSNITTALPLLAAFSRYSANVAGSGPFADFVAPTLVVPDNLIKQCAAEPSLSALLGCRV